MDIVARDAPGELERYDPEQGLKTIAVAEAAEKHYARAKDHEQLFAAVELKLTEQRRFVLWWDAQEKAKGGEQYHKRPAALVSDRQRVLGRDGLPDRGVIHRWRERLKADRKFAAALETAQERCRRVCEAEKGSSEQRGASGTGENEWHTPARYLEIARTVLGKIELDPATSEAAQETVKADRYFTRSADGLKQEWRGCVWLNPPYAQPAIGQFVDKLVAEWRAGRIAAAIMLTHNYTDSAWFHVAAGAASAICFTRGRVGFVDPQGAVAAPTQGQAFHYFGPDVARFVAQFGAIGFVVLPARATA